MMELITMGMATSMTNTAGIFSTTIIAFLMGQIPMVRMSQVLSELPAITAWE